MRKTKVVSVALLSLLVVFSPVASAVAQSRTVKTEEQQSDQSQQASSVFREIEARGGQEVDDERLEEEKGEGPILGLVGVGVAIWDGVASGHSKSTIARNAFVLGVAGLSAPSIA